MHFLFNTKKTKIRLKKYVILFRRRLPESNQTLSQTDVDLDQNNEPQKSGRKLGRQVSVSPSQDIRTLVRIIVFFHSTSQL